MRPAALWAQRTATQAPDRHVLPLNAADRRRRTWAGLLLRRILHLLPLLGGGRGVRHALGTTGLQGLRRGWSTACVQPGLGLLDAFRSSL